MRSGKRVLAGVAAGALGAGLLVGLGTTSAQASTVYGISIGYPSVTVIAENISASQSLTIPITYTENGNKTAINTNAVAVTMVKDDTAGFTVLGSGSTQFANSTVQAVSTGVVSWELRNGASATNFSSNPTGVYTLTASALASNGVALASTSIKVNVVSNAGAGSVTGSATFLDEATGDASSPLVVATNANLSASAPQYVYFANATGGPILGNPDLFNVAATPTDDTSLINNLVSAGGVNDLEAGYVYRFNYSGSAKWQATPGTGKLTATYPDPLTTISGTLGVTISASATLTDPAITTETKAAQTVQGFTAVVVPTATTVKFTVSGITNTTINNTATPTANVPATITITSANTAGTAEDTASYSAASPALPVSTTSGPGGVLSQEFTVSNPVAGRAALVQVNVPGANPYKYLIRFATPAATSLVTPAANVTAANTGTVTLTGTVVDQFSRPVPNWPVRVSVTGVAATGAVPADLTTNATGVVSYTITVPANTVSGAVSTVAMAAWNGSAYASSGDLRQTVTVTYTSGSAAVSALAVRGTFDGAGTSYSALLTGNRLNTATNPMYVNTAADLTAAFTAASNGYMWKIQATATNSSGATVAGAPITVTPADGGYVQDPATGKWAKTATVYTSATGTATAVLGSTKTGEITYELASGATKATVGAFYGNRVSDARYVAVSAGAQRVPAGSGTTITATVTDRFGNPVRGVGVTFNETGPGYIGGTGQGTTGAAGTVEATLVTVTGQEGVSTVTAEVSASGAVTMPSARPSAVNPTPTATTAAGFLKQVGNVVNTVVGADFANPAVNTAAVTIAGVTAGKASDAVPVTIEGPASRSISITGSRTTIDGKNGIKIDGAVTGIENGKTVVPYFRFPGETTFSQGSARPVIADGAFTWQRKTGKKFYAYVTNDDGQVTSNRVIIAAA